ncbi:hypothetical protein BG004_008177 [Podila humilis]|nr:hypothetical protein BG004_008177 [Podila humilis]
MKINAILFGLVAAVVSALPAAPSSNKSDVDLHARAVKPKSIECRPSTLQRFDWIQNIDGKTEIKTSFTFTVRELLTVKSYFEEYEKIDYLHHIVLNKETEVDFPHASSPKGLKHHWLSFRGQRYYFEDANYRALHDGGNLIERQFWACVNLN